MADEQQIEGLPEGATLRPVTPTPAATDPSQVEGLPEGATLRPVTPPATKVSAPKAPAAPHVAMPVAQAGAKPPVAPLNLTNLDESNVGTPQDQLAIKAARGVRGLYHGLAGDETTPTITGKTSTASPVAENVGFTPENVGYNLGKMGRGIGEFAVGAVKDIAGNTPIAVPNEKNVSMGDPQAHTLMAKYITAPSLQERESSQKEMEEYFKTKGPEAAGHAISALLHGTLGEYVPGIGPLVMALTDQAQKGDIGGAMAQIASLYAFEKGTGAVKKGITDRVNAKISDLTKTTEVKQAEANVDTLGKEREAAQAKLDAAKAKHQQYTASHQQGIGSPEKVANEVNKAQEAYDESEAHHELAKEDLKAKQAAQPTIPQKVGGAAGRVAAKVLPTPAPAPEAPIEAAPVLSKLGEKPAPSPVMPTINVKTPGQVQPETFPQEPKPAPRPSYGRIALPNDQGTMGAPKQLTEGTPEGPQVPKGGLPKINLPEEKPAVAPKLVTDETSLRALKANGKGGVEEDIGKKIHGLLKESLKTDKGTNQSFPAAKVEEAPATEHRGGERRQESVPVAEERRTSERRNAAGLKVDEHGDPVMSPDVEGHWQASVFGEKPAEDIGAKAREENPEPTRAETKPVLPKEEPTQYAAKKEEVVPTGAEGREPATPAAEYHPEVRQRVFELGNEDLKALARAHGLNPDAPEYAFGKGVKRTEATATSSGRQQTGRAKLADDVTAQMSDDEKINIGRNARTMESEGTFKGQDVSNASRAEQARKLFPRLNAEETTGGYGSKNTGVTKEAKDAAVKSFNDKATRSNAGFDPTMLKDAAKVAAYHIEAGARAFADFSAKMVEDFGEGIRPYLKDLHTKASEEALGKETAKTSAKDTDHMQAAIKELGPDAKLSDITKRAQEMKDTHAQVAAHNENGGSTFHPTKGDLNGKPAFSVGGEPEFKSPDLKMTTDGKELTTAQRDEFANRPAVKEALDKHKDASIGTWYDKETDKTTTELVKTPTDRAEAIAMGQKNGEKAIYDLGKGEEIKTGGTGEGSFPEKIERPTTTTPKGGSELPTRDALVKKYGETKTNDPKGISLILDDGTKIPNTGVDHNQMVGGKTNTVKNSSLERFMDEGNIRVRESQGAAGRTVSISIPKSGVNAIQWEAIKAMGPQLRSGGVAFEVGNLGGKYETIGYGEATDERMQQAISNITGKGEGAGEAPQSVGGAAAGAALGKEPPTNLGTVPGTDRTVASLLNPKEKGTLKSNVSRENAVENMAKLPAVQEVIDAAQQGAGERKWYQRSGQAFTALSEAAKDNPAVAKYFKPEMRDKFVNFLAALSPQQSVKMDMQEALHAWTKAVDLQADGTSDKQIASMLHKELTMSTGKVNNAMKALKGEPIWDDLRTKAFKVPSFGDNINGFLDRVVNDGWMALFHDVANAGDLSKASLYHPISALTRLAAEHLGWEPAEAQAAIWAVIKALTEKGTVDQGDIRTYSHDMADLMHHDPDIRQQLTEMGFDTNELDKQLAKHVEAKPEVTSGVSASGKDNLRKLVSRVQRLRPDALSAAKIKTLNDYIDQASEPEGTGREPSEEVGSTDFNHEDTVAGQLAKLGEKKKRSPFGKL